MFRHEIWCLLRKNISKGQLLGYAIANVVGLSVILIGILFFADSQNSTSDNDKFFSDDYIVLSKKVDGIGFKPVSFSDEDISKLKEQKWVQKIGRFTASQFAVNGAINLGGRGLSTYLFFESVPDDFFDVVPRDWTFNPDEKFVPVILSKDYLTLYNFGFAIPQGLPQVSEQMVGAVPIVLRLTGKDNVTESSDAADVRKYLDREDIEIAGDKNQEGNISQFLSVVSSVVASNGVVISILALFILTLSIFLLLQKSRETIRKLMFLGFSPREISRYYEALVLTANVVITVVSTTATLFFRTLWIDQLREIGLGGASVFPMLATALAYLVLVTTFNVYVIRNKLDGIWHSSR